MALPTLQTVLRRYFWVVNVGFVSLGALFGSWGASSWIERALAVRPPAGDSPAPPPVVTAPRNVRKDPMPLLKTNIFNHSYSYEAATAPPDAGVVVPQQEGDVQDSKLNAELVGTIVAQNPAWSFAAIRDKAVPTAEAELYRMGSAIQGWTIIEIDRWPRPTVILELGGTKEKLEALDDDAKRARAARAAATPPTVSASEGTPTAGVDDKNIKKLSESDYVITRQEVQNRLSNLNQLATEARIVPHFEGGKGAGFKLFSIRPGSLYSKIGITNGDVIQRINGEDIDSPDKAFDAWRRLKDASSIQIELSRGGAKKKLNYQIQ
jgi:general secretion pathway protein C